MEEENTMTAIIVLIGMNFIYSIISASMENETVIISIGIIQISILIFLSLSVLMKISSNLDSTKEKHQEKTSNKKLKIQSLKNEIKFLKLSMSLSVKGIK